MAPPQLRRNIAVYEAARALLGYLTPDFDEISKVCRHHHSHTCKLCSTCMDANLRLTIYARRQRLHECSAASHSSADRSVHVGLPIRQTRVVWSQSRHNCSLSFLLFTLMQIVACPGGLAVGHTYFIPSEEHLESGITTRAFMEAKLVVCLAGRCALHKLHVYAATGSRQCSCAARVVAFSCSQLWLRDSVQPALRLHPQDVDAVALLPSACRLCHGIGRAACPLK